VIMARVSYAGQHFVFAPDVQGPVVEDTTKFILDTPVDMLVIGGPPYYLESSLKSFPFDAAKHIMNRMHEKIPVIVIDHHCCRDKASYEGYIKAVLNEANDSAASQGHVITSAAGYMGNEPAFLESSRADLFASNPPHEDFMQWMHMDPGKRNHVAPPID
jgi:predicted metallo-beta-lactamase superfamily hydrolase